MATIGSELPQPEQIAVKALAEGVEQMVRAPDLPLLAATLLRGLPSSERLAVVTELLSEAIANDQPSALRAISAALPTN